MGRSSILAGRGISAKPDTVWLFFSHAFRHDRDRRVMHRHLQEAWLRGFVYDSLEPTTKHRVRTRSDVALDRYLQTLIREVDIVVVVAAMYFGGCPWMIREMEIARDLGKPIIPVLRPDRSRFPSLAVDYADRHAVPLNMLRETIKAGLPRARREVLVRNNLLWGFAQQGADEEKLARRFNLVMDAYPG